MNRFAPILSLFFVLFSAYYSHAQSTEDCEHRFMIHQQFGKESGISKALSSIHLNIIKGKYKEAQSTITDSKKKFKAPNETAAILCYEANIAYNESQYQHSIDLCNTAIQLMDRKMTDPYVLRALNFSAKAQGALNRYDDAMNTVDTVILIAEEIEDQYNLGAAYYYLGSFYSDLGDYSTCAKYVEKSIVIRNKIKDEIGLAACYSFLGLCYSHLDNYFLGIDYIQKSIAIRERIGDKRGLANSYLTMYRVYFELGELEKALDSEKKSLKICRELGDQQCITGRLTNIGQILQRQGNYKEALSYHYRALALSKQLGIKNRVGLVHENISRLFLLQGKLTPAQAHIDSSLVLRQEIHDKEGIASCLIVSASILLRKGDLTNSIQKGSEALALAKNLKLFYLQKEAHQILSQAYDNQGNASLAFDHFKDFVTLKDSLFGIDQSKELVKQELEFNFKKREEKQQEAQQKREEETRKRSQQLWNIILFGGIFLIVISGFLALNIWLYRQKNRSQKELMVKNAIIEEQHKEITDSIHYAQQIQHAVLPDITHFEKFFSRFYVHYLPKDVISGDFYWGTHQGKKLVLAVADCTGHGVPGGFMSMLGISLLNELIIERKMTRPNEVLDLLREKVIASLNQKAAEREARDGMDMSLFVFDPEKQQLTYSLANHRFFLIQGETISEIKGDRFPIGAYGDLSTSFQLNTTTFSKGDKIISFTDGVTDQFGGSKQKKFGIAQLRKIIEQHKDAPVDEICGQLRMALEKWSKEQEQTDDITLIGIEL